MKQLAQTFLVVGGLISFIISIPVSVFGWAMHKGFGGDLSASDWLLLYGPAICLAAAAHTVMQAVLVSDS